MRGLRRGCDRKRGEGMRMAYSDAELTVTELWPRECDCTLCGALTAIKLWLPMYEGKVLTDDDQGEWAGMPVCADCYAKHRQKER